MFAVLAARLSWRLADTPHTGARWVRRALIWITAAILAATAHLGALMVWGDDYFSSSS